MSSPRRLGDDSGSHTKHIITEQGHRRRNVTTPRPLLGAGEFGHPLTQITQCTFHVRQQQPPCPSQPYPRPVRSTNATPSSSYNRAKALLSVGCGIFSDSAARVMCSVEATATTICNRGTRTRVSVSTSGLSIRISMQRLKNMHWTYEKALPSVEAWP